VRLRNSTNKENIYSLTYLPHTYYTTLHNKYLGMYHSILHYVTDIQVMQHRLR